MYPDPFFADDCRILKPPGPAVTQPRSDLIAASDSSQSPRRFLSSAVHPALPRRKFVFVRSARTNGRIGRDRVGAPFIADLIADLIPIPKRLDSHSHSPMDLIAQSHSHAAA